MNPTSVKDLFDRFFSGQCTAEERQRLLELFNENKHEQILKALLEEKFANSQAEMSIKNEDANQILEVILSVSKQAAREEKVNQAFQTVTGKLKTSQNPSLEDMPVRRIHFHLPTWFRYAAVVLTVLGIGTYLWTTRQKVIPAITKTENSVPIKTNIVPGGNKAVLTLADGRNIVLDSAANGQLTEQGNVRVIKLANGEVRYEIIQEQGGNGDSRQSGKDVIAYNTMSTPRGGQYQLSLPDGTKVWLNAESSISYPVKFTGQSRDVSITGEAYFEVAKNPSKPFTVKVNDMLVEVLGTHFNVMAYGDEPSVNTTLFEGSVKISGGSNSGFLKPGQQSVYYKTSQSIGISKADTEKALAWKNGNFMFNSDDIRTIMRQLSRWYDVSVTYEGEIPSKLYSGIISKYVDASEVLEILELAGIKFKIDGKNITVLQ